MLLELTCIQTCMTTSPHDLSFHIEVLANLIYLVKMEADDPSKVCQFAEVAELHLKAIQELFRAK